MKYAPAKRGSYGQPGTTLSERKGAAGVAGEYGYVSHPYDSARIAANEARVKNEAAKARQIPRMAQWPQQIPLAISVSPGAALCSASAHA